MRKILPVLLVGVLSGSMLFSGGCASSERMARMSGGVVGKYSEPSSVRIRSEKYQKIRANDSGYRMVKNKVGFNDTLVNIWPFFFRSDAYFSFLWPFIDFDRYGMAIRPFYNHEGDDYSILFPLSSWNPSAGSGWFFPAVWGRNSLYVFPLGWYTSDGFCVCMMAYHSWNRDDGCSWITPLFIRSWKYRKPTWKNPFREKTFFEFCLAYHQRTRSVDLSNNSWLFQYPYRRGQIPAELKRELAYRFTRDGKPVPANLKELNVLRENVFAGLPDREENRYGFFPLFHYESKPDFFQLNIFAFLMNFVSGLHRNSFNILGGPIVCEYKNETLNPETCLWNNYTTGEKSFFSIPLLSQFVRRTFYRETPEIKSLRRLYFLSCSNNFERSRPEMEQELRKIAPDRKLPAVVTDRNTMELFLRDLTRGKEYPVDFSYTGGFLPLFLYSFNQYKNWWFVPALLTGGSERIKEKNGWFFSLPLLAYHSAAPKESVTAVAPPLLWYSKKRVSDRITKEIFKQDTRWTRKYNMSEFQDDYAALGLYYHGKNAFYVAKPGVNAAAAESLRKEIFKLRGMRQNLDSFKKSLADREHRNKNWKTKDKIEYYQKLIEMERILITRKDLVRKESAFAESLQKVKHLCAVLKFKCDPERIVSVSDANREVERLFDYAAERRWVEDFGNGFFYRKELYYNGDNNWRFLFGLASGEKNGTVEDTRVLGFLYRFRKTGNRSEELIFPFIAKQRDGKNYRTSFLWRLWEKHSTDGKTGGYLFFFPYGAR